LFYINTNLAHESLGILKFLLATLLSVRRSVMAPSSTNCPFAFGTNPATAQWKWRKPK